MRIYHIPVIIETVAKFHGTSSGIRWRERGLLMKGIVNKSILIGNGININFGGRAYTNENKLRTNGLKSLSCQTFFIAGVSSHFLACGERTVQSNF